MNQPYIGIQDEANSQGRPHLWLGCMRPESKECDPNGPTNGRPGGTFCSRLNGPRDCLVLCGDSDLTNGKWHHLVVTKQGHTPAIVNLWVDGHLEDTDEGDYILPITFDTYDLGVGHFSVSVDPGESDSESTLDEVSIWRRALNDSEIANQYARGALDLRIQVRVCERADCDDDPLFVGPDGTVHSSFRDLGASDEEITFDLSSMGLKGRYFQYKVEFSGPDTMTGPALFRVSLTVTDDK